MIKAQQLPHSVIVSLFQQAAPKSAKQYLIIFHKYWYSNCFIKFYLIYKCFFLFQHVKLVKDFRKVKECALIVIKVSHVIKFTPLSFP